MSNVLRVRIFYRFEVLEKNLNFFVCAETLRLYPPFSNVMRKVTKEYRVPDSDIVFKEGMMGLINIYGIHRDPEYYPNPGTFDPERFSKENIGKRHPMAFIPFGNEL